MKPAILHPHAATPYTCALCTGRYVAPDFGATIGESNGTKRYFWPEELVFVAASATAHLEQKEREATAVAARRAEGEAAKEKKRLEREAVRA